jgi:hypothetical protein
MQIVDRLDVLTANPLSSKPILSTNAMSGSSSTSNILLSLFIAALFPHNFFNAISCGISSDRLTVNVAASTLVQVI